MLPSEVIETSILAEDSEKAKLPDIPIGAPVFRYPIWWSTFIMFQREGCSATEAYQRSRPELHTSYDNYARKASLLLRDRDFNKLLTQLEAGSIDEIESWKRVTMARVVRWRDKIDKKAKEELESKDISLLTSSEKTLHEMGNKVLGIKDEETTVAVQVNFASVVEDIYRKKNVLPSVEEMEARDAAEKPVQ